MIVRTSFRGIAINRPSLLNCSANVLSLQQSTQSQNLFPKQMILKPNDTKK